MTLELSNASVLMRWTTERSTGSAASSVSGAATTRKRSEVILAFLSGWSHICQLGSEVFDGVAQPFFERHLRLPPEHRLGFGNVRLAALRIVLRQRLVLDARLLAH